MTSLLIIILCLSLFLGVITSVLVVKLRLAQNENKFLKNVCKTVGEDVYSISSRLCSGNVSHSKGNLQNMGNLLKQMGE